MHPGPASFTYDDLLQHDPSSRDVVELLDGVLVQKASPRATHAHTQGELRGELHRFRRRSDGTGWWILVEPDIRFSPRTVLRPDLAGWRAERLAELPDGPVDVPPDWVCEVLSPSTELYDRGPKRAAYAQFGVAHLWLASPEARVLETFELVEGRWMWEGTFSEGQVTIRPFDGAIDVSALFVAPGPGLAHESGAPPG